MIEHDVGRWTHDASGGPSAPLRVAVVTNVLPHYRAPFYRRLFQHEDLDVEVFCQPAISGMNLQTAHHEFPGRVTLVRSISLKREVLGWQRLPWRKLQTAFDVVFVLGNPRIMSNVLLAGMLRSRGRRWVIWGQAHTAGANPITEQIRLWWWRTSDNLLVYTDGEVRRLRAMGLGRQHIVGINNGLDQDHIDAVAGAWDDRRLASWRERSGVMERTQVLSCARLEPKNRFDVWLAAMSQVIARYPDLVWCVVGDGPERPALEAQARRLGVTGHVRWLGSIVDETELAPWFLSSRLLVHPDGIGLSLLHAFGYGLPVVTQGDAATQYPEFDAFVAGETGLPYGRGDAISLATAVCRCLSDEPGRRRMGERARRVAREQFNVGIMVSRFVEMAKHAAAE
jgi:glycosyltransferase involved in cell wall biosynthesis